MKTDDLIQQLASDLKPTKPMLSPLKMTLLFALFGLVLIAICFFVMSARPDLKVQLSRPEFIFDIALALLLSLSALALAVLLSRPGRQAISKIIEKVTLTLLGITLLYDAFRVAQLSQSQIQWGLNLSGADCFATVLGFSIVLGAALIYWLRKGASVNPNQSGLVIGTACVALGNVSIIFFCNADNGMHTLLWHFALPMVAALATAFFSSRLILKW